MESAADNSTTSVTEVVASVARKRKTSGQATIEMALILMTVLLPITLGLYAIADLVWTYHALVSITRQGAKYAATHCYEDDAGSNVVNWMQVNSPAFLDRPQLASGAVGIQVNYWTHDLTAHASVPFACGGDTCSPQCIPDAVTVGISGYQFKHLLTLFGLQPLQIPSFATTVEFQGAGGDPETGISTP